MWETGIRSCGATATLAKYFLEDLGFEVLLVDGIIEKEAQQHAWIVVKRNNTEFSYDLTIDNNKTTKNHVEKNRCNSWWDLKDLLFEKHITGN